jgi:hypothetical protein
MRVAPETPINAILALYAFSSKKKWILCALFLFAVLLLHPIDALVIRPAQSATALEISGHGTPLFMAGAPLGQAFATEYIHSVQRTPVEDIYRIVNGRIWSWQERVQSHNAGLPFARPPFGRFRMDDPPWMVVEGGWQSWDAIILRVGNAELGRNVFSYGEKAPRTVLFERFPGQRLELRVERRPVMTLLQTKQFP